MTSDRAQRVLKASHSRRRPAREAQAVEKWNATHHVGAPVFVVKDLGEIVETATRSKAFLVGGHTAMVQLDGISGGYMLARVVPRRAP